MRNKISLPRGSSMPDQAPNEMLEFVKAWGGTSLAFAIFISAGIIFQQSFLTNLLIAALTCGVGFVVHEFAHRVVARGYGSEAHFFSNDGMLFISVLAAFAGIFIAAPGAVWHRPLSPQKSGIIAIVGPISNLVLAALFFLLMMLSPLLGLSNLLVRGVYIGYAINAWLGLFNMIPVDPFDGGKVWRWNKIVFVVTAAVAAFMVWGLPQLF